jgi:soluble lytic murein transglycosylase-like protein
VLRPGLLVPALAIAFVAVPATRGAATRAWHVLEAAIDAGRAADARRVAVFRYAARYDIPFDLALDVYHAAEAEGVDPDLAFRLVKVESEFNEHAVSPVGALGLTQLMPATAAGLRPGISREEIFARRTNLHLGFRYLHGLLREYRGRVPDALHAYNRGPGTVDRIRAAGGDPANGYADRVLGHGMDAYRGTGTID